MAYRAMLNEAEKAGIPNLPSFITLQKAERDHWYDLHAKNPKNVCAGLFKYGEIDIDENGRYDKTAERATLPGFSTSNASWTIMTARTEPNAPPGPRCS